MNRRPSIEKYSQQIKGETWPEKRSELESIIEDFFIKAALLTRPDGIRVANLDYKNSPFIYEASKLIDLLERGYHATGTEIHIPDGAKHNDD